MDFHIRLARENEADVITEIEDKAGEMLSGLGLIDETLDIGFPIEKIHESIRNKRIWVACVEDDVPVGMVIVSEMDGAIYIEEMDVLPTFGRRGIGALLLEHVCECAEQYGYSAVTLSTFCGVPWNGPFYSRHGFRDLKPDEWSRGMILTREKEAEHGLRVEDRVFMRRDLTEQRAFVERRCSLTG